MRRAEWLQERSSGTSFTRIFHVYVINKKSYGFSLVQFEINLHLSLNQSEIALAEGARAVSAF